MKNEVDSSRHSSTFTSDSLLSICHLYLHFLRWLHLTSVDLSAGEKKNTDGIIFQVLLFDFLVNIETTIDELSHPIEDEGGHNR